MESPVAPFASFPQKHFATSHAAGGMLRRPLVPLVIAAVAGILAAQYGAGPALLHPALAQMLAPAFALLLTAAALFLWRNGERRGAGLLLASLLTAVLFFWRTGAVEEARRAGALRIAEIDGTEAEFVVEEAPLVVGRGAGETDTADAGTAPPPAWVARVADAPDLPAAHVLLYVRKRLPEPLPLPGDRIQARLRLYEEETLRFPGGFSRADANRRRGFSGRGTAEDMVRVETGREWNPFRLLHQWRSALTAHARRVFPGESGRLIGALLFGDRSGVGPEMVRPFRLTGTGHILAISGLHVGLVTGVAWWFFRRLLRLPPRLAAAAGIAVCLLYLGVSGGRPSAVRAGVMAAVYLGGIILARKSDLLNALACAALLILLHHPPALEDIGFLLSFTAVLFLSRLGHDFRIFRFAPPGPEERRAGSRRLLPAIGRNAWGLFLLSVAAWAGLWPLSVYYFHLLSFASLGLNVIIIPWLSVVLVGGMLGQLAALLPDAAGEIFAWICQLPAAALIWLTRVCAAVEGTAWRVNTPPLSLVILYYALFLLFFLREPLKLRARLFLLPALLLLGGMVWSMRSAPPPAESRITLLPARGGGCAVVESSGDGVAVAGRLPYGGFDAADLLRQHGRGRLDALLLIEDEPGETEEAVENLGDRLDISGMEIVRLPWREESAAGQSLTFGGEAWKGIRVRTWRDAKGRLLRWRVEAGPAACEVFGGWWAASLLRLVRSGEPAPTLALVRLYDETFPAAVLVKLARLWPQTVLLPECKHGLDLPPPWTDRRSWGAVQLMESSSGWRVEGFDGTDWRELAPIRIPRSVTPAGQR